MSDAATRQWQPSFGVWTDGGAAAVRLWAPAAESAAVEVLGGDGAWSRVSLVREETGFFGARIDGLTAGARYRFVLDDGQAMPDPASRCQPEGVHGPSEVVDPSAFVWQHAPVADARLDALVIYELHLGTFTPEGTFAAAADKLPWLASIGVTAIELMPVAEFAGARNWGYDGAALFAPDSDYGSPDDLRRLVDRAHGLGLVVLLDVVYNHFGPDGAYAAAASDRFFSEKHRSPWGRGINLDGLDGEHVRRFFVDNALQWIVDYRFDGLRLDATHALVDDSDVHFLAELSETIERTVTDRRVLLCAEDHRNLRTLLEPRDHRGYGLDAVWADDFHHVARRLAAGDDEAYFQDFRGTAEELTRALRLGWLYQGESSAFHGAPRGTDSTGLGLAQAIICLQNHDQIGNRALGERLHHGLDPALWRALSTLLLSAPETPLLFMGQEWAATSPFLYFTDHEPELGRLVSEGRREEFKPFRAFTDPERRAAIPDPQAPETFAASKLRWDEITRPGHAQVLALYRDLLHMRRDLSPEGAVGTFGDDRVAAVGERALWLRRTTIDGRERIIAIALTSDVSLPVPVGPADRDSWLVHWHTEQHHLTEDAQPPRVVLPDAVVHFARPGAVILEQRS